MNQQKIIIRKVNKSISIDINKFESEASNILKNVVIPQMKNAERIQNFDKKKCISPKYKNHFLSLALNILYFLFLIV